MRVWGLGLGWDVAGWGVGGRGSEEGVRMAGSDANHKGHKEASHSHPTTLMGNAWVTRV